MVSRVGVSLSHRWVRWSAVESSSLGPVESSLGPMERRRVVVVVVGSGGRRRMRPSTAKKLVVDGKNVGHRRQKFWSSTANKIAIDQ